MPHHSTLFAAVTAAIISLSPLNAAAVKTGGTPAASEHRFGATLTQTPLTFVPNRGQWPKNVYFRTESHGATAWIGAGSVWYSFVRETSVGPSQFESDVRSLVRAGHDCGQPERLNVTVSFEGALTPAAVGEAELSGVTNYFIGRDPAKWQTNVPTYASVRLDGIYPGIDVRYYTINEQLEYDFIVAPQADYHQIRLNYSGVRRMEVSSSGDLNIETEWNTVTEHRPIIFQEANGERIPVEGEYALTGDRSVSFNLKNYDKSLPLIIDPAISYSTFLGGVANDNGGAIAVDSAGNMYVVGSTRSWDFPADQGYDSVFNATDSVDVFVSKFSPDGQTLLFSTFVGGTGNDYGYGLKLGAGNEVAIVGYTRSSNFPTTVAGDTSFGGGMFDAFAARLSASGDSLIWSSYIGGSSNDYAFGVAVDASGNVCVVGATSSSDFPTKFAYDTSANGLNDIFAAKLAAADGALDYATYMGGLQNDFGLGITVDASGRAYITGYTESLIFPCINALDSTLNGTLADIVVAKFGQRSDTLLFSTLIGSAGADLARAIEWVSPNTLWVAGQTGSSNFPVPSPYDGTFNGGTYDAILMKLTADGSSYTTGTYLGGMGDENAIDLAVDPAGEVFLTGTTTSNDFPLVNAFQLSYQTAGDAFLAKFNSGATSLLFSSYLGGQSVDNSYSVDVNANGSAYLTGETSSANFPKVNPWDAFFGGQFDAFITIVSFDSDGDGVEDAHDNCVFTSNPGQEDADGDLVGDVCDNCQNTINANQANADGDAFGDLCDVCPNDANNDIDGDGVCGNVDNCPSLSNPLQEDSNNNGIGDKCETGYTVPGTNVAITYGGITVTFPTVTTAGVTEIIIGVTGLPQPDGYVIQPAAGPLGYEVKTTAGFTGTPVVCLNYNPGQISGSESTLKWLRYQSGNTWTNVTGAGYPNVSTNYICGTTTLGTFALAQAGSCCVSPVGNIDCDPANSIDISDLTALIDNLFVSFTPLCCTKEANVDGAGGIDIADLTFFIDHLFITFVALGNCQ